MTDSCLVQSYNRLVALSDAEAAFLRALEENPQNHEAGEVIAEQGSRSSQLFVVSSGWCTSEIADNAGHCQIVDVHLPGDIIGTREVAFARRLSSLRAVTPVTVCPFPRTRLNHLFQHAPRLSSVFVMIAMRREAILSERIFDLGRRDATSRVCHFLLEIQQRLEDTCTLASDLIEMPLTQQQLADALGLTSVHISRVIRRLRETGVVDVGRSRARVLDHKRLMRLARLNEEYLELDTSWIDGNSDPELPHIDTPVRSASDKSVLALRDRAKERDRPTGE